MPHTHSAGFQWQLALTVALLLTAVLYLRGWVRLRSLDPDSIKPWHAASFLSGLFFIWIALASPIAALDHQLLTIHMVQHLLLMTLAAPLIWLGAPEKRMMRGLPQGFVEATSELLHSTQLRRLATVIAHPAVCWFGALIALVGWHVPLLFALGMRSEMWHGIEQASFLGTGLLFWWPVFRQRWSASNSYEWTMLLYLFLATLPCDLLSGFLVFCDRVVYPVYSSSPRLFGFSVLEDQQCAGALMWTCVTVVYLIAGTILAARLLAPARMRRAQVAISEPQLSTALRKAPLTTETI